MSSVKGHFPPYALVKQWPVLKHLSINPRWQSRPRERETADIFR
jgi:hypothetical protein